MRQYRTRAGEVTYPFLLDCRQGRSGVSSAIPSKFESSGFEWPHTSPQHLVGADGAGCEWIVTTGDSLAYRFELFLPDGAPLSTLNSRFLAGLLCLSTVIASTSIEPR